MKEQKNITLENIEKVAKALGMSSFDKFLKKFIESFGGKDPMFFSVLGNVFSMRIIGNKTHGDLAEIAEPFFKELLADGYKINEPLITLIAKILVSRKDTHEKILKYFFSPAK